MSQVVVTGASSFLGIQLVKKLLDTGHSVIALVRPKSFRQNLLKIHPKLQIIELALSEYHRIHEIISKPVDIVFAMAWNGTRGIDRDNYKLQQGNYLGSIGAVQAFIRMGCKIIITSGSQAEYGLHNTKISEIAEEKPVTDYGRFKLQFYRDAIKMCSNTGVKLIEPRFFSVYGPGDFEGTLVISTIRNMFLNKPCDFTKAEQMWDFLYIDDAIEALLSLADNSLEEGVYNLGSGIAKPLREYIYEMLELASSHSVLNFGAIPYPESGMVSIEPDISKILQKTAWTPKVTFEAGISQIINVMRNEDY